LREIKKTMKKVILIIIAAVIVAGGIGGYFIFKKPVSLEPKPPIEQVGKCGDNICELMVISAV